MTRLDSGFSTALIVTTASFRLATAGDRLTVTGSGEAPICAITLQVTGGIIIPVIRAEAAAVAAAPAVEPIKLYRRQISTEGTV